MKSNTPQVENGYTRIASGNEKNDVLMALVKHRLNATQYQIILLVIRKTWGYNKKEDWISLTQFENYLSKSRPAITNEIKELVKNNILVKKSYPGIRALYSVNKEFNQWKQLGKKTLLGKKTYTTSKENLLSLVKKTLPTKDNITKDNIQYTKNVVKKTSRNSLIPCTIEELKEISNKLEVGIEDVSYTHQIILNKIAAKEFKNKTVYHTLCNWLMMGIQRKTLKKKEKFSIYG